MATLEEINKAMEAVKQSIQIALRSFQGQPVNDRTYFNIKNTVLDILQPYYENGTLDSIPLIDVNHTVELTAIGNAMIKLAEFKKDPNADIPKIDTELRKLSQKFTMLRDSVNPKGLHISLKDPITFMPYVWPVRGKYDH